MKKIKRKSLCELCFDHQIPFKARRSHWGKGSYVTITGFDDKNAIYGHPFAVYGIAPAYRSRYIVKSVTLDSNGKMVIPYSHYHSWEVI